MAYNNINENYLKNMEEKFINVFLNYPIAKAIIEEYKKFNI